MENLLFNFKFLAKQLNRYSVKCLKEEKREKLKCKRSIQKGNMDNAKVHAENAIRQKNQSLSYLKLSARVDTIAARVQEMIITKQVTYSIQNVNRLMETAMKTMNLEKITNVMDLFEKQFDELKIQTNVMEDTISNSTCSLTPETQVDFLLKQIADETGIELNLNLPDAVKSGSIKNEIQQEEEDSLIRRLSNLKYI